MPIREVLKNLVACPNGCVAETLIYWLWRRIAALRGARILAYLLDMSPILRSVRLALHPPRALNQHLLARCSDARDDLFRTSFTCRATGRGRGETLIDWLRRCIAALCGSRILAYPLDMARILRFARRALHSPRSTKSASPPRSESAPSQAAISSGFIPLSSAALNQAGRLPRPDQV